MSESTLDKTFLVPHEHPCFKDHFPEQSLVPGALLISWLVASLQEYFPELTSSQIKSVKFISPVFPGDECNVLIDFNREKAKAKISLARGETLLLKGEIRMEPLQR